MSTHTGLPAARRHSALSRLFALYVSGRIAETSWMEMMDAIDEGAATPEEREGLAEFFADAYFEEGSDAMKVPAIDEIQDFLVVMRAD